MRFEQRGALGGATVLRLVVTQTPASQGAPKDGANGQLTWVPVLTPRPGPAGDLGEVQGGAGFRGPRTTVGDAGPAAGSCEPSSPPSFQRHIGVTLT